MKIEEIECLSSDAIKRLARSIFLSAKEANEEFVNASIRKVSDETLLKTLKAKITMAQITGDTKAETEANKRIEYTEDLHDDKRERVNLAKQNADNELELLNNLKKVLDSR